MGGKPSKGTKADKRLKENQPGNAGKKKMKPDDNPGNTGKGPVIRK